MKFSQRTKVGAAVACVASFALLATGCSSAGTGGASDGDNIELTITTFGSMGMSDLYAQYEKENPGITIKANNIDTGGNARTDAFTKIAAGSGLSDVTAVEEGWLGSIQEVSDQFVDLSDYGADKIKDRWVPWKLAQGTDKDGRIIAYGTDIGPEGLCYNSAAFAAAGLPTDRTEVAALLEGDWENYFSVGEQFTAASDAAWFDGSGAMLQGILNQHEETLEATDGEVIATTNPVVKDAYEQVLDASPELSAHLKQWSDDWTAGFANGAFATMLCPSWILGNIEGAAPEVTGWDVANVFPGGGGNWGGSYLTVPAQGKNAEEAKKLAAWLTAPEQQLKSFVKTGNFPSQLDIQDSEELTSVTRPFFNEAPTGEIFAERAAAITVAPFKSVKYFPIMSSLQDAVNRVDVDKTQSADDSWKQFEADVASIG